MSCEEGDPSAAHRYSERLTSMRCGAKFYIFVVISCRGHHLTTCLRRVLRASGTILGIVRNEL